MPVMHAVNAMLQQSCLELQRIRLSLLQDALCTRALCMRTTAINMQVHQ